LPTDIRHAVAGLSVDDLSVTVFSESLVQTFAGDAWLDVLGVVDGEQPTATHRALAELGRRRVVSAIVSTNFDTLIERAFRDEALPLAVFADPRDYQRLGAPATCALYKIHGSAKETSTIVDTVGQKLRGLALPVRTRIAELARQHHVLVLGFSGADLAFSDDYLGIAEELTRGPGITWLVRAGDATPDRAARLVAAAGPRGAVVEGVLPDFLLTLLGAEVEAAERNPDAESQAGARIRSAVAAWLAEPTIGPLACAVYVARLLALTARPDMAAVVREHVAREAEPPVSFSVPDRRGLAAAFARRKSVAPETVALVQSTPVSPAIARAYGALAREALAQGAVHETVGWLDRQAHALSGINEFYAAQGMETPARVEEYRQRALVELHTSRATCAQAAHDAEAARLALGQASLLAESAGDLVALAAVQLQFAGIAADAFDLEQVLARLAVARTYADASGDAARLLEIELLAAETYLDLAEYGAAHEALERAARVEELSPDPQRAAMLRHFRASLLLRRGQVAEALPELHAVVAEARARGDRALAHRLGWMLCVLVATYEPERAAVLALIDELLTEGGGERLQQLRNVVASGGDSPVPFLRVVHADEQEGRLRGRIEVLEYRQTLDELPAAFAELRWLEGRGRPVVRDVELARAQLGAAERSGSHDERLLALNSLGVAHDLADEPELAIAAYEAILAADPPPPPEAVPAVQHNLAITLSRLGRLDEATELFADAAARHEALGDDAAAARSRRKLEQMQRPAHEGDAPLGPSTESDAGAPEAMTPEQLGQLSLAEWSAGEREAAWATSRRALAAYRARGDLVGASRCLNNQAQFSALSGDLDEACRLSREALAVRAEAGDVPGQVATLGWLAQYELQRDQPHAAVAAASRAVALAGSAGLGHEAVEAGVVLVAAHAELGDDAELVWAAERLLEMVRDADGPRIDMLRASLEQMLALSEPTAAPARDDDALGELWAEADRLSALGRVEETDEVLERLGREFQLTPAQRGRIEGTRAVAAQSAGKTGEAETLFDRAIQLMDAAGDDEGTALAEIKVAIIARQNGRYARSAEILRSALGRPVAQTIRHELQIALANTLQAAYQAGRSAPDLLAEARALLTLVADETNVVETRGIALVNLGMNWLLEGRADDARATIRASLDPLRHANSPHLATAEQLLQQLG